MPYLVTTHRHLDDPTAEFMPGALPGVSRRAVATLEEARDALFETLCDLYPQGARETGATEAALHANGLPESGGTVGPLPDGTVIEVERVGWTTIYAALRPFPVEKPLMQWSEAEIIDAFNARQAR